MAECHAPDVEKLPSSGIEPEIFCYRGRCSNHWATGLGLARLSVWLWPRREMTVVSTLSDAIPPTRPTRREALFARWIRWSCRQRLGLSPGSCQVTFRLPVPPSGVVLCLLRVLAEQISEEEPPKWCGFCWPQGQSKCRLPKPFQSLGIPTAPSMIMVMPWESLPNVCSQPWQSAMPQMWKSCPARELNPRSSAIAAGALTTELQDWDKQQSKQSD